MSLSLRSDVCLLWTSLGTNPRGHWKEAVGAGTGVNVETTHRAGHRSFCGLKIDSALFARRAHPRLLP